MVWTLIAVAIIPALSAYSTFAGIRLASALVQRGVEVHGIIINQRTVRPSRGADYVVPRVRFKTLAGEFVEGESASVNRGFVAHGGLFSTKVEFFDNADAYLRYSVEEPGLFLFVHELNQTHRHWQLALTGLLAIGTLLMGLFGV